MYIFVYSLIIYIALIVTVTHFSLLSSTLATHCISRDERNLTIFNMLQCPKSLPGHETLTPPLQPRDAKHPLPPPFAYVNLACLENLRALYCIFNLLQKLTLLHCITCVRMRVCVCVCVFGCPYLAKYRTNYLSPFCF